MLVCVAVPFILPIIVAMAAWFLVIRRRYLATSREVKRFEAVTRSPVYTSFADTMKARVSLLHRCLK